MFTDTSGPTKAYGVTELDGLKAAAAYYNANGGMSGHQVELTVENDNGDPTTAASLAVKALSSDPGQYTMVYPGDEGSTVAALTPVVAKYPVFAISINDPGGVCLKAANCPHQFAEAGGGGHADIDAANFFKQKGYTKVGILAEQSAFTEPETAEIETALKTDGVSYVVSPFPQTAVNLTSAMSRLKSDGAQTVFAEAVGSAAPYTLKARAALGWSAPVLFDIAGSAADITKLVPKAQWEGNYYSIQTVENAKYTSLFPAIPLLKKYGPAGTISTEGINIDGVAWDSLVLLNDLIKQAGSTSVDALTNAAENIAPGTAANDDPLQLAIRRYLFSATNHENAYDWPPGMTSPAGPSNYAVVPIAPVVNGQVQASTAG